MPKCTLTTLDFNGVKAHTIGAYDLAAGAGQAVSYHGEEERDARVPG